MVGPFSLVVFNYFHLIMRALGVLWYVVSFKHEFPDLRNVS